MDAVAQDIKDRTLWVIGTMENLAEQARRQAADAKKSGWTVLDDLAIMYGQQKALHYRKKLLKELEVGLPAGEAVAELLERVEDDVLSWSGSQRSTSPVANVIAEQEQVALIQLVKELRNALKHIGRTVAVENGLGTGVLTNQQQ